MPADRHQRTTTTDRSNPIVSSSDDKSVSALSVPSNREAESVNGLRVVRSLEREERHIFSTRLQSAIMEDNSNRVKRLLADKVNIAYEPGAATPVHSCARSDKPKCCRVLLEFGFDPNHTDHKGRTPLAVAVANGSSQSSQVIEEYGGVLQARTNIQAVQDTELDDLAGDMAGMMDANAVTSVTLNNLAAQINNVVKMDGKPMGEGSSCAPQIGSEAARRNGSSVPGSEARENDNSSMGEEEGERKETSTASSTITPRHLQRMRKSRGTFPCFGNGKGRGQRRS
ncbi:hypothetical protein BJ684DRAFT_14709 [Piptocephalis cylindrospora]|uniref:Uncharacterized protein n=1 Tax=Piptocephalis cylindrospora TaxID=1907219 RepID=A0A4P9Y7K8_9FUNG|nr:hypothetical protein BJ684DRAFT_14709 [Piptocephalis cylindrospora]|eukprot:RKP15005.1 hypothetical protein BJ684DRAFT_14709 [Piptocephalis cylindrospora]